MKTQRVEALADGLFSIAMTLLVIEVHVPHVTDPSTAALWSALMEMGPSLAAFAVSFIILGTLWVGHHNQFIHIRRADRPLIWINIFFLLTIAFLPFSTGFLAAYSGQPMAGLLYGGNLMLAGAGLWTHWSYATSNRRLVNPELGDEAIRLARRRITYGFVTYGLATLAALWSMPVSLVLFALQPILYILPGRIDRHLVNP